MIYYIYLNSDIFFSSMNCPCWYHLLNYRLLYEQILTLIISSIRNYFHNFYFLFVFEFFLNFNASHRQLINVSSLISDKANCFNSTIYLNDIYDDIVLTIFLTIKLYIFRLYNSLQFEERVENAKAAEKGTSCHVPSANCDGGVVQDRDLESSCYVNENWKCDTEYNAKFA